jgi:hypothetical protein
MKYYPITDKERKILEKFTPQTTTHEMIEKSNELDYLFSQLAARICTLAGDSTDRDKALTKLIEANHWSNEALITSN